MSAPDRASTRGVMTGASGAIGAGLRLVLGLLLGLDMALGLALGAIVGVVVGSIVETRGTEELRR